MTARPEGRAVKPGLERRFFAACAAASPLSFGGNKTILPSKLSGRQASLPGHGRRHPSGSLSSLSFEGSRFVFLPSCRHCRLCMKIAGRGGTAFSLFPFRSPAQHGLSMLPDPYRSARRATRHVFFFELQRKKVRSPKFFRLRTSRASPARARAAALRCCSLKHKNPGPSELFSVAARRLASR